MPFDIFIRTPVDRILVGPYENKVEVHKFFKTWAEVYLEVTLGFKNVGKSS